MEVDYAYTEFSNKYYPVSHGEPGTQQYLIENYTFKVIF